MRKLSIRFVIALLTFLLGVAATAMWLTKRSPVENAPQIEDVPLVFQEEREPPARRPNDAWESIYFEEINERAGIANLPSLRSTILPRDDFEIRVWHGFGISTLVGFVLKRADSQWSAIYLNGVHRRLPRSQYQRRLQTPKSGWEATWMKLTDEGILTLPDSSELQGEVRMTDGFSYVVEINMGGTYRTYQYGNPEYQRWEEAGRMIRIGDIIADEFHLETIRTTREHLR